jgi:hypothetical protein
LIAAEARLGRLGRILTDHVLVGVVLLSATVLATVLDAPGFVTPTLMFSVYGSWFAGIYVLLSRKLNWRVWSYGALLVLASLCFGLLSFAESLLGFSPDGVSQFQRELLLCFFLACWTFILLTNAVIAARISKTTWGTVGYFVVLGAWPCFLFAIAKHLETEFRHAAESRSLVQVFS